MLKSNLPYKFGIGLSAALTVGLILFFLLQLKNIVSYLKTVQSVHFPILEHNSISVRLEESMYDRLKQSLLEKRANGINDFEERRDGLNWNVKQMEELLGKAYPQVKVPSRTVLEKSENRLLKLVKEKQWTRVLSTLESEEFSKTRSEYTQNLQQLTETLSLIRDSEVHTQQLLFNRTMVGAGIVSLLLGGLWSMVIFAYRENLRRIREAEAQLEAEHAKAIGQSKLASLGEMAGGIAHEINNPLAIISMHTSRIKDMFEKPDGLNKESSIKSLNKINDTVDRISRIIRGLKSMSRNSAADPLAPFKVQNLIQDTIELCQIRFKNHGLQIDATQVDPEMMIDCRPAEISQVVMNLMNNAFDAIEKLEEKWIKVEARIEGNNAIISVTDSGHGIPPEIAAKIMSPFFTTKEIGKGTGLGLSIALGIAKGHNGTFTLDSECKNTRFVLTIPLSTKNDPTKLPALSSTV